MSWTFFTDRDLGLDRFSQPLRDAGFEIERHCDHFVHNAPDEEWIPAVAEHGWVVLSANTAMTRQADEVSAIMESGAMVFLLVGGNATKRELGLNFVNSQRSVQRFLAKYPPPFIAKVHRPTGEGAIAAGRSGRVKLHTDLAAWQARQTRATRTRRR